MIAPSTWERAAQVPKILAEAERTIGGLAQRLFEEAAAPSMRRGIRDTAHTNAKDALGPLDWFVHAEASGMQDGFAEIGIFRNRKALIKLSDGSASLMDVERVRSNNAEKPTWIFYDATTSGKQLLSSIRLAVNPEFNPQTGYYFGGVGDLLLRRGAEDTFLSESLPVGSIPVGIGGARVAFRMHGDDISLLGPRMFRPAMPDMLFPRGTALNHDLQVERLEYATNDVTQSDIRNLERRADNIGWFFGDRQLVNAGRLHDGALKIIDADAVHSVADVSLFDRHKAIPIYNEAVAEALVRYPKNPHAVAALRSELGRLHLDIGSHQGAEENLARALPILETHQDWKMVAATNTRLASLYSQMRNHSKATEHFSRSIKASELQQQLDQETSF